MTDRRPTTDLAPTTDRRPSSRRPGPVSLAVAATAAASVLLAACGGSSDPGGTSTGTRGTVTITAPADPAPDAPVSTTLPPLPGAEGVSGEGVKLEKVGDVTAPTALVPRSGTTTMYVAQQDGRVKAIAVDRQVDNEGKVVRESFRIDGSPILDISRSISSGGERGLLGLAFSSDGRKLYVDYTDPDGRLTVDEYRMNDDRVDTSTRRNIISVEHERGNHNGGQIGFGPDGFLYIAMGDGGGGGDPDANGQNPGTLLGTILRVDPEGESDGRPYGIPPGNPFADGVSGAPEVWTWGLRNPWRFSWDRDTKDLWIADVGQNSYEEINFLAHENGGAGRGANMGWSLMEGTHPYEGATPPEGAVLPIFDYDRANGECSVTGGYLYRGARLPTLAGVYLYADYCKDDVRGLLRKPDGSIEEASLGITVPGGAITTFGQDADGELFVASQAGGIYRLVPA
jgi:glucose/arabinose dehydrogenase